MKTIRKYASNKFFISFMTFLVFTFSSFGNVINHKKIFADAAGKTGEQIFREILFFEGNTLQIDVPAYRDQLDQIKNLNAEQRQQREEMITRVIQIIKKNDVNYFNKFKSDITSDNPYTIQKAVSGAGQLMITSLNMASEYDVYNRYMQENGHNYDLTKKADVDRLSDEFSKISGNSRLACVAVVVVLVLALAVAAAVAWVSFNLWFTEIASGGDHDYERLEQELLIKQLIANY